MTENLNHLLGQLLGKTDGLAEDVREIRDLVKQQNGRVKDIELKLAEDTGAERERKRQNGIISGVVSAVVSVAVTLGSSFLGPRY